MSDMIAHIAYLQSDVINHVTNKIDHITQIQSDFLIMIMITDSRNKLLVACHTKCTLQTDACHSYVCMLHLSVTYSRRFVPTAEGTDVIVIILLNCT